jgi:hypothetical protein
VVLMEKPRLIQVDGIYCEAALCGYLIFMKNQDVPGVIGHVGTVLGKNRINIANFSLGRREGAGSPSEAVALVSTDELVPETVLAQLREHPAVKFARSVEFRGQTAEVGQASRPVVPICRNTSTGQRPVPLDARRTARLPLSSPAE